MHLNILISCFNESVKDVHKIILHPLPFVRYIISHQYSADYQLNEEHLSELNKLLSHRKDIFYNRFEGRGLSQNRNHAIEFLHSLFLNKKIYSTNLVDEKLVPYDCSNNIDSEILVSEKCGNNLSGENLVSENCSYNLDDENLVSENCSSNLDDEICVLADDDVRYKEEYLQKLYEIFQSNPSYSLVCTKISTPPGSPGYKWYSRTEHDIKKPILRGKGYVSSIEISFRLSSYIKGELSFDEGFGLGSNCPEGGEETVFISDFLRGGFLAKYVPEYTVEHPFLSTGKKEKTYSKAKMMLKVAVRCTGYLSWETFIAFLRCIYRRLL